MHRTLFVLPSLLIAFTLDAKPLIQEGQSAYKILLPAISNELVFPPGDTLEYAATFLADHIEQATGCRLPIVWETDDTYDAPMIALGATRLAGDALTDLNALGPEAFSILMSGKHVIICGGKDAQGRDGGTLFGVYEFLERVFGIRWYFGDDKWYPPGLGTVIPKQQTINLPDLDIHDTPAFLQRAGGISYYSWPLTLQKRWHPVLRFGDTRAHGTANHTQIGWTDLYGKTHPEYFAIGRSGRRQINFNHKHRSYICLTNPDVLKQMIENIEGYDRTGKSIGAFGPRDPEPHCIYFCPNDGMTPETVCHCEGCRPFLRPDHPFEGHSSELIFQFVRRYAEAIDERWPGRRLAVLAYSHYKLPPQETSVPDNVDITYVGPPIQYAADPAVYQLHQETVAQWSKRLNDDPQRLNLWMNVHSPNDYASFVPTMYLHTLSRWLREHRSQVSGYFINGGNPHLRRRGPRGVWTGIQSFPMTWMQSRMLWNPDCDPDALVTQYCEDLFGPAAETMHTFYTLLAERWEGCHPGGLDMDEVAFIHRVRYPEPVIDRFKQLIAQAADEARDDAAAYSRITFFRDKIYTHFLEESRLFHAWGDQIAVYTCLKTSTPPKIDGRLDDRVWQNVPAVRLVQRQWGEPSDRTTEIRLLHDGTNLYVGATLHPHPGTALTNEQLWIQAARKLDPVSRKYATNIDRRWDAFIEIRIDALGKLSCKDPLDASIATGLIPTGGLTIEARLALKDLATNNDLRQLRMQFLRTWGDWQRFDLWSPTLSHISDFPTYRFGLVQLTPGEGVLIKSSLE